MARGAIVALACALALGACVTNETPPTAQAPAEPPPPKRNLKPAHAIGEAKDRVVSRLKDPDSARFTEVSYKPKQPNANGEPTDVVCGMVNAKDSNGGYTGAKPFVYLVDRREVTMAEGEDLGTTAYRNFCAGGFASVR